jgi:uroporphyrinogen decarboxylase
MAVMGIVWSAHFQDTCAAFGMETALVKMITEPEMYNAVCNKVIEFYLKANEIYYEATKGKLDAVLIGNDLGSQTALMLSPDMIRKFVLPGTEKFVEQAKSYGLKVIHHSCGAIYDIIPDLIIAGVDVIHPIQALAKGMEPQRLKDNFGDKVSFCGGVDAQELLVNGTPKEVTNKILELKQIFNTGLIISPSHEAILPDIRPENIKALYDAVGVIDMQR